jgi:hypothetical protein
MRSAGRERERRRSAFRRSIAAMLGSTCVILILSEKMLPVGRCDFWLDVGDTRMSEDSRGFSLSLGLATLVAAIESSVFFVRFSVDALEDRRSSH